MRNPVARVTVPSSTALAARIPRAPRSGSSSVALPAAAALAVARRSAQVTRVPGALAEGGQPVRAERPDSSFAGSLPADVARRARWTSPVLAAEVAYRELTPAGRMRHPVWRGLRPA